MELSNFSIGIKIIITYEYFKKFFFNLKELGLKRTFLKVFLYPFRKFEYLLSIRKIKNLDSKKKNLSLFMITMSGKILSH